MLSPFICGSGSFNHQHEEDDRDSSSSNSPCSTPRKSRKSNKDSKNPYSTRGLDKFSALVAELEEKRQKIYSQVGSQDISFVRFVYSNSNEVVPIVVKLKDQNKQVKEYETKDKPRTRNPTEETLDKVPAETSIASDSQDVNKRPTLQLDKKKKKKLKLHKWRRPSYYMPLFIILILLFLAFFGRSVAILCTSIGWYIIPTLSSKRPSSKPPKKKQLMRRFSELSPVTKNIDNSKFKSPHDRQNSF